MKTGGGRSELLVSIDPFAFSSKFRLLFTAIERGTPLKGVEPVDRVEELHEFVTALEDGDADVRVLQKLVLVCSSNPIPADTASPLSPRLGLPLSPSPFIPTMRTLPPVVPDMWTKERSFDRLFDGLLRFLDPAKVRLISPP